MGMLFPFSLQHLIGRMAVPFSGDPSSAAEREGDYELLWQCYAAGGLSEADLEREIAADPALAAYLRARKGRPA
ncbi:hypothetical protein [Aestuariivirga sp.]|uniref:hypothetical protein n=1 Tax=Aestuariivirga sp. TaxID=2650926 RepID=UPI003918A5A8